MLKKLFDKTLWKFILVGVINTLFGTAVMFLLYNIFLHDFSHTFFGKVTVDGYWISSAANYILGSILSYFLNKYFTFQYKKRSFKIIVKFVINILICYLVAYGIAKPLVRLVLSGSGKTIQDNVSMLVGLVLFTGLNYLGQRFFAFKDDKDGKDTEENEDYNS